jgi:hypothetical protein
MIRQTAKIAAARIFIMAATLAMVIAGLPVGPARASTLSVVSYWGVNGYKADGSIYQCGKTWYWPQGNIAVDEVYNPCNTRVWVHYDDQTDPGASEEFCVNPDGGLAYGFPLHLNSNDISDIQLTSNTSPCDSTVSVIWEANLQFQTKTYDCQPDSSATLSGFTVDGFANYCDSRIWLHGSGNSSHCVDPTTGSFYATNSPYSQIQMTNVEAPRSATPPYPY